MNIGKEVPFKEIIPKSLKEIKDEEAGNEQMIDNLRECINALGSEEDMKFIDRVVGEGAAAGLAQELCNYLAKFRTAKPESQAVDFSGALANFFNLIKTRAEKEKINPDRMNEDLIADIRTNYMTLRDYLGVLNNPKEERAELQKKTGSARGQEILEKRRKELDRPFEAI